ncbi:DUF6531 domain-containing protein, partial [Streptomyces sp. NPDC057074]|uniref:DUF6531 domain-containing protein n=1 Tax=Streptomyces sp. NPDC057074 TaxID=3346015 RepID=UPI00364019F4
IQNRSWWEDVDDSFSDNWDTIVAVCKVVVAVVGIVAMIIGGPILGAIVLVAALVVLADTLYKYSKGQASLWDVGLAALDCIPGMKGLTSLGGLAKGLKGGMAAMAGIKGGMKGMGLALRGLGKNARGMVADGAKGAYNRVKSVVRSKGSDPVDMATGAMYLPQTDVELPGLLPLAFTRRVASDYRCGWWFGPTWASTLDQRIEVDEAGVNFVTEDGLILSYPHPSDTSVPVMPEAGPRRPLTRTEDGGYRIDEPVTGHAHHFARPTTEGIALLVRLTDRNQHTISFDHDEYGTPLAIRHSGGYHLKLTTDDGRVTALSLAGGAEDGTDVVIKRYGYTDGNLTAVTNSSGLPLRFTYDERLRVTSWEDTNHRRYAYAYDDQDRCVAEGGEAGHITITLDYDGNDAGWPDCRVTTLTTAEGAVTRFVINGNSQVVAEADPLGGTVRTEFDANHHVVSWADPLGHMTFLSHDDVGRVTQIVDPDGAVTHYSYSALGRPTEITMPNGAIWRRHYDQRGNCLSTVNPSGGVTRYEYDHRGHLTKVVDVSGAVTVMRSNAAGLSVEVTDALGNTERRSYDAFGRERRTIDALGVMTERVWTVEGLIRSVDRAGAQEWWDYDGEGNCVRHIDAGGRETRYTYTHFDLLASRILADGSSYSFQYDSSLRMTGVTNPEGLTWRYEYDQAGRLRAESDFDGRLQRYEHDRVGRLTARMNALGQVIRYERDALGRVISKQCGRDHTTYDYDALGHVSRAVGQSVVLEFRRDAEGRLTGESVNGRSTAYHYDDSGRLIRRVMPSGTTSSWSYDDAGYNSGLLVAGRTIGIRRDAVGRELAFTFDESLELNRAYDDVGRLTEQGVTALGQQQRVQHRSYEYEADGSLSRMDDRLNGARDFDLDAAGRVTTVRAAEWTEGYAYDSSGNQIMGAWPADHPGQDATGVRTYEGMRIKRAGRVRFEYDAQGRVVLRQKTRLSRKPDTWRYEWDAEDRLISLVTPDGAIWRYQYDPFGRRTAKLRMADDGRTVLEQTLFAWDGTTLAEQETVSAELPHVVTLSWHHHGLHPIAQSERLTSKELPDEEVDSRFYAIVTDLVGAPA